MGDYAAALLIAVALCAGQLLGIGITLNSIATSLKKLAALKDGGGE